ncbi:MAG: hypothetical protein PT977_02820 [Acidobacteriota bacterium]|nr:hypothetical protein [Acidobacteriota bacterium]
MMRLFVSRVFLLPLLAVTLPLVATTYAVHPSGSAPSGVAIQTLLGETDVGEKYCNDARCIVLADSTVQLANLNDIVAQGFLYAEPLPLARKVLFSRATWDADARTWDHDFPGMNEVPAGPDATFVVVFKSFLEYEWVARLQYEGFTVCEPLPLMAYLVYGRRDRLLAFASSAPHIRGVLELPAGIKRFGIDTLPPGDNGSSRSTLVAIVNISGSEVKRRMRERHSGSLPPLGYQLGNINAYEERLTRDEALEWSRLPEIVTITRNNEGGGPSDGAPGSVQGVPALPVSALAILACGLGLIGALALRR